uniref:Zgc:195282 n=1 Tax=Cyprinodon variegatus TaxID=28743 RepID=A0A3Q2CZR4_CYPVA
VGRQRHRKEKVLGFPFRFRSSPRLESGKKGEKKRSLGRDYHPLCLKCQKCNRQLTAGQHAEYDEKPFCTHCYMKLFGPRAHR